MRLKPKERDAILQSCKLILPPRIAYQVFVFGSRAVDSLKGGDIDLLLLTDGESVPGFRLLKRKLANCICKELGDQRIDIVVSSFDPLDQSEFVQSIRATAIELT